MSETLGETERKNERQAPRRHSYKERLALAKDNLATDRSRAAIHNSKAVARSSFGLLEREKIGKVPFLKLAFVFVSNTAHAHLRPKCVKKMVVPPHNGIITSPKIFSNN